MVSSSRSRLDLIGRYAVAIGLIAASSLVRRLVEPRIGERVPFLLEVVAVMAATLQGGVGPGLVAAVLGGLTTAYHDFKPIGDFAVADPVDQLALGLYGVLATLIVGFGTAHRRAWQRGREHRERLAETLAHLDALVAGSPIATALLDRDLRYIRVNQAMSRLNGVPVKEHLGRTFAEVLPEIAALHEPTLREVVTAGTPRLHQEFSVEIPGCPGQLGHWLGHWFPVRACAGEVIGVGVMVSEVTALKVAEDALRQGERRYRTLTEAVLQLMWVNESDGRTVFLNRRWNEYAGVDRDSLVGLGWTRLIHADDLEPLMNAKFAAIPKSLPYETEFRLRRSDGVYRWHIARIVPMLDGSGQVENWFGTATDVHEMKLAEESLRASRDAAEAGSRARDQFLAVLSHELRNPLMPVLVSVSALLEDPELPAMVRPTLELTRRNVELEARLIDDLLDVTRIPQGKLRLEREPLDAHELVRRAVEICRDEIAAKRQSLSIDLAASHAVVEADPARLQQVLWNLIKNAAKFTPTGGSITVRSRDAEGSLLIEVSDSGIGIAPEVLPKVFDAFEQGDPTVTRQFGGLGLGLAISRSLAEGHRGTLTASSPGRGQGSTFTLTLPTTTASPRSRREVSESAQGGEPGRLRILLVEDNLDSLRVLTRLLKRRGHEIVAASCVSEALEAVATDPVDLLISDIGLPDGNGLDLMRAIADRVRIGGIALSGFGTEQDLRRSDEAGFLAHLTKPVDFPRLEAAIRELIRDDHAETTVRPGTVNGDR
jgi:PAS domain S-box-containing protein